MLKMITKSTVSLAAIALCLCLATSAKAQTAQAWNAFAPTFTAKYTVSTFTPDTTISVSRIQVQVIPPLLHLPGCKFSPVLEISGGEVYDLTLTGGANDSGLLALSYPAGSAITLSVSTAAECLSWATGANIVVQYDTSALSGEVTSLENQLSAKNAQNASLSAQVTALTNQTLILQDQLAGCLPGGDLILPWFPGRQVEPQKSVFRSETPSNSLGHKLVITAIPQANRREDFRLFSLMPETNGPGLKPRMQQGNRPDWFVQLGLGQGGKTGRSLGDDPQANDEFALPPTILASLTE